jgi:short-subunit dehydrogenase
MQPERNVVVITGAGSGIGRALAGEAARDGAYLVLVGRRHSALDETAAQLADAGTMIVPLDVTDAEACQKLAAQVGAQFGRVDMLVNNAGRILVGPVDRMDPVEAADMLATNLLGPMVLTSALLPLLRQSASPRIVNVGSMLGDIAMPMFAAYSASKFGLRGWSDGLRRELAGEGIRVTHAAPRATRTRAANAFTDLIEPFGMKVDSPEATARRIWRDVRRRSRSSYPAGVERIARAIQAVAPSVVDSALASQLRRVRPGVRA